MISQNVPLGIEMLKSLGYDHYTIYKNRQICEIKI